MYHDEPIYWAPQRKLGGGWLAFKSSPSPAPAPDYTGAANATAAGNLETAKYTTEANRANQTTPWASINWTQGTNADGTGNNKWTQTETLAPQLQSALDSQMQVQNTRSQAASALASQVNNQLSKPIDTSGITQIDTDVPTLDTSGVKSLNQDSPTYDPSQRDAYAKAAYTSAKALLDPQYQQQEESLRNNLALQGLSNTSEAFGKDMGNFYRGKDDAYNQLANQSLLTGQNLATSDFNNQLSGFNSTNQARANAMSQALTSYNAGLSGVQQTNAIHNQQLTDLLNQYNLPINQLNSLLTGQQVSTPQFNSYAAQNQVAGPDLLGAATQQANYNQGIYNSQAASASSANSALGSLLGNGAMAYFL